MRTFIVNDQITVVCESYETSKSWGHKATVLNNGEEVCKDKIRYYNRTWESFQYASILSNALYKSKLLPDDEVANYTRGLRN